MGRPGRWSQKLGVGTPVGRPQLRSGGLAGAGAAMDSGLSVIWRQQLCLPCGASSGLSVAILVGCFLLYSTHDAEGSGWEAGADIVYPRY